MAILALVVYYVGVVLMVIRTCRWWLAELQPRLEVWAGLEDDY